MRPLFRFLTSLRTAIALIGILSLISMVGTLVPQGREAADYLVAYPRIGQTILALGLDDLYHGKPFYLLLALLAVSSIVCTITRLRLTRAKLFSRLASAQPAEIASMPAGMEWPPEKSLPDRSGWQQKALDDGSELLLNVRGRASLVGGLLIHAGFVAILAGGMWGSICGVEMAIFGMAGESSAVPPINAIRTAAESDRLSRRARAIQMRNPKDPELESIRSEVDARTAAFQSGMLNPECRVKFEKLWVEYHEPSVGGEPSIKSWNSEVTVSGIGHEPASGVVRVNQPLAWGDYTFYQADWKKKYGKVDLLVLKAGATGSEAGTLATVSLEVGKPFKPDWSSNTLVLIDFYPDFRIMGERVVSISDELRNPAGHIVSYGPDGKIAGRGWAFVHEMAELSGHMNSLPYRFEILSAEPVYESGLRVAYDPGVPVVWAGCLMMTLGLCLTFYISYYETWLWRRPDGRVWVAVSGNRPAVMLKSVLDSIVTESAEPASDACQSSEEQA